MYVVVLAYSDHGTVFTLWSPSDYSIQHFG